MANILDNVIFDAPDKETEERLRKNLERAMIADHLRDLKSISRRIATFFNNVKRGLKDDFKTIIGSSSEEKLKTLQNACITNQKIFAFYYQAKTLDEMLEKNILKQDRYAILLDFINLDFDLADNKNFFLEVLLPILNTEK